MNRKKTGKIGIPVICVCAMLISGIFCSCGMEDRTEKAEKNAQSENIQSENMETESIQSETVQSETEKTEIYVRRYEDAVYANLMERLDVCLSSCVFDRVDEIENLQIFYEFFYNYEYGWGNPNRFYNADTDLYEIPGEEFRRVIMKYLDFESVDLTEYFWEDDTLANYYDREKDMVYTKCFGGFGGEHDGWSEITFEILEPGVVQASAVYNMEGENHIEGRVFPNTNIVVKEEDDGVLKLVSFTKGLAEAPMDPVCLDTTEHAVTVRGKLEYDTKEVISSGEFLEGYILNLNPEIKELIYYDYDYEKNETQEDIKEIDVTRWWEIWKETIRGQYDGRTVEVTGKIWRNYNDQWFTDFQIVPEDWKFVD